MMQTDAELFDTPRSAYFEVVLNEVIASPAPGLEKNGQAAEHVARSADASVHG